MGISVKGGNIVCSKLFFVCKLLRSLFPTSAALQFFRGPTRVNSPGTIVAVGNRYPINILNYDDELSYGLEA